MITGSLRAFAYSSTDSLVSASPSSSGPRLAWAPAAACFSIAAAARVDGVVDRVSHRRRGGRLGHGHARCTKSVFWSPPRYAGRKIAVTYLDPMRVRGCVEALKRLDSSVEASRLGQADTTSGELAFGILSK